MNNKNVICRYNNGDVYTGEYTDDKRNGKGIMRYKNNEIYEGSWKDGKKEGEGIFIFENNIKIPEKKYIGEFINNEITGKGTMFYKNGEKYSGMMENKKRE